ncbi:hypothetical protein R1sor_018062 [Riccia sorocarpa]|uniref:Uncharacterized protein n=1 Tax=Riccia sorocarpa TaxID=122646 RepID=A0ABD3ICC6_9MARC
MSSSHSSEDLPVRSDDSGSTHPARGKSTGGRGRGKKIVPVGTPSVRTRSQRLKDPPVNSDTMSTDSADHQRSLWKDVTVDQRDSKSACSSIIDKYRLDFNGKQPPKIPLCRLEPFTRVRKLQLSCTQAEDLKKSFRLNGYMDFEEKFRYSLIHHPRVRCVVVKPPPDALKEIEVAMHNLNITSHATVQYDWIQVAERTMQVLSTPLLEYKPLLGEKVYAELVESRKKTTTRGWYSDNMTITAGAYIMSYSEVMAAQKELSLLEKDMESKGTPLTDKQKNERWKRMLSDATKHWNSLIQKYATIVNPQLGPEFMAIVRELQTTLSLQEKGRREVKVEVGVDRIKAFAAALVPPDLKIRLLKVHYSNDVNARLKFHHPPGNDVDSDIRPWLHQWGMWAMLESYSLQMLTACVSIQLGDCTTEVQAEEEDKFLVHIEEYRNRFWKEVWNSGTQDRQVESIGRRAKRLFFRYVVWVRRFDVYPACFNYWRQPPKEVYSMFSEDDNLTRKYDDLADWERSNCPFYVDYTNDPSIMFNDWEQLCYDRRLDAARAQIAMEEAESQPENMPALHEAYKLALDKLPQVFDPRKLQGMSPENSVQQAKEFEPNADRIHVVFDVTNVTRSTRRGRTKKPKTKTPYETVTVAIPTGIPLPDQEIPDAEPPIVEVAEPTTHEQQKKKKKVDVQDLPNGEFRTDLQFAMEGKWIAVKSDLLDVIMALRRKKQMGRAKTRLPAIDELASICKRLKVAGRRPRPFVINGQRTEQGADLIMMNIPTGRAIASDKDVPGWNTFPHLENQPRLLLNLSGSILDDKGYVIIMHSGSLESSQQIADMLEAMTDSWKHFLSYDVLNEKPTFLPNTKLMVVGVDEDFGDVFGEDNEPDRYLINQYFN